MISDEMKKLIFAVLDEHKRAMHSTAGEISVEYFTCHCEHEAFDALIAAIEKLEAFDALIAAIEKLEAERDLAVGKSERYLEAARLHGAAVESLRNDLKIQGEAIQVLHAQKDAIKAERDELETFKAQTVLILADEKKNEDDSMGDVMYRLKADAALGALVRRELPELFTAIAGDFTRVNQAGICDPDYVALQVNQEGWWSITGYWDDGDETKSHDYIRQDSIERITEALKE